MYIYANVCTYINPLIIIEYNPLIIY